LAGTHKKTRKKSIRTGTSDAHGVAFCRTGRSRRRYWWSRRKLLYLSLLRLLPVGSYQRMCSSLLAAVRLVWGWAAWVRDQ